MDGASETHGFSSAISQVQRAAHIYIEGVLPPATEQPCVAALRTLKHYPGMDVPRELVMKIMQWDKADD